MTRFFTDMTGYSMRLDHPPMRIVSLVPSQTELLFDLGLSDEVVGITKFCVHPDEWFRSKKRVGGTKNVHIDVVKTLHPDLVIANKEENTQEDIEQIRSFAPVWTSDIKTLDDALVMIRNISVMTGTMNAAMAIERKIKSTFAHLQQTGRPKSVLYLIWKNPYMGAGGDTFIHDMIQRTGLLNVLATKNRYPELEDAQIKRLNPEVVMLSSEPFPFNQQHIDEVKELLPKSKIILVDGEMFSWYGSRLIHACSYFKNCIHELDT